jgi:hypothetical protein
MAAVVEVNDPGRNTPGQGPLHFIIRETPQGRELRGITSLVPDLRIVKKTTTAAARLGRMIIMMDKRNSRPSAGDSIRKNDCPRPISVYD